MKDLEEVAEAGLFRGLTVEQKTLLAALGRTIDLGRGEYLCRLGEEARDVFIVRSGLVELVLPVDVARKQHPVVVDELSIGETIGWSALAPPCKYTLDARAAAPQRSSRSTATSWRRSATPSRPWGGTSCATWWPRSDTGCASCTPCGCGS